MRVRALSAFCVGGGIDVKSGEEFDCPDHMVRYWVQIGNVAPVEPEAVIPASGLTSGVLYTQDGKPVHMDPKKARST